MGTTRIGRAFVAASAVAAATFVWGAPPASATSTVTVTVDVAQATLERRECTGVVTPLCVVYWSGSGMSLDGLREWELRFTTIDSRPCYPGTGEWQLTAADGSGDGLAGRLNSNEYWPAIMEVTSGSGAYAGAVDTVPFGREQNFRQLVLPVTGLIGCGRGIPLGVWAGSLEFTFTIP